MGVSLHVLCDYKKSRERTRMRCKLSSSLGCPSTCVHCMKCSRYPWLLLAVSHSESSHLSPLVCIFYDRVTWGASFAFISVSSGSQSSRHNCSPRCRRVVHRDVRERRQRRGATHKKRPNNQLTSHFLLFAKLASWKVFSHISLILATKIDLGNLVTSKSHCILSFFKVQL